MKNKDEALLIITDVISSADDLVFTEALDLLKMDIKDVKIVICEGHTNIYKKEAEVR